MAEYTNPFLRGVMGARSANERSEAQQIGILSRLVEMQRAQQAAAQSAEMRPLQMDLLRSQIAERQAQGPIKALEAQERLRQSQARGALSNLSATGGYQGATDPTTPTAVAGNDADAIRMLQAAGDKPMAVNVPNPQNMQALAAIAYPQEYGKAMVGAMFPKEPKAATELPVIRAMRAAGVPEGSDVWNKNLNLYITKQTTQPPGTNVTVDARGQNKYVEALGKSAAEADMTQYDNAQVAADNIPKIDFIINHLRKSDAITGIGAEVLKNVERVKALVTQSESAGKKVSDTELLDSLMGSDVFPMIKALGIGARGLDTPAEREFLRQVMTGTVNMNKNTLLRMAKMRRDVAERAVKRWNERMTTGEVDQFYETTRRPKRPFSLPPSPEVDLGEGAQPSTPSIDSLLKKYE